MGDAEGSRSSSALRTEAREWLTARMRELYGDGPRPRGMSEAEDVELRRRFAAMLARDGWAGFAWDPRFGGRGGTVHEQLIFIEECVRAGAPDPVSRVGQEILGPTLMRVGTVAQQQRFLKPMLTAEEIWCLGFSEPDAGSDLAALRTRAVAEEDGWRITGQKTWTTLAQFADLCFLLARTDPDVAHHRGLSVFIVDMDTPGITVRPIEQITGSHEFCEVFFDDVLVPRDRLVGEPAAGWRIAMTALGFERGTNFMQRQVRLSRQVEDLVAQVAAIADRVPGRLKDRLVDVYLASAELQATVYHHVEAVERGEPAGPDNSATKLHWSETLQAVADLGAELEAVVPGMRSPTSTDWAASYVFSRATTIYAGTSQVHRNIVAERGLGLPA